MNERRVRYAGFCGRGALVLAALLLAPACGGAKDSVTAKAPAVTSADQIDADPVALLPGEPLATAYLDAKAAFAAPYGESLSRLVDRLVPASADAGLVPSRDIETLWAASYGGQGLDSLVVARGKFDEAKLKAAAERTAAPGGAIVQSTYGERKVYTVSNVGVVILTPRTALIGTETSIRRSIDRVQAGNLKRSVPGWMLDTLATPSALFAAAADLETQPMPSQLKLPVAWLQNVKTAKVVGTPDGGVRVKGLLKFATPDQAQAAERGLKQTEIIARALSITGVVPRLADTQIKAEGGEVEASFRVEDRGISSLLDNAKRWLGGG